MEVETAPTASSFRNPRDQLDEMVKVTRPHLVIGICGIALIVVGALVWAFCGTVQATVSGQGLLLTGGGLKNVTADSAGTIRSVSVRPGDVVSNGQQLAIISTLTKSDLIVSAATAGTVVDLPVHLGQPISVGTPIAVISPVGPLFAKAYVPLDEGKQIKPGMSVRISPATIPSANYGYVIGTVASIAPYPVPANEIANDLDSAGLAQELTGGETVLALTVSVAQDPDAPTGVQWSSGSGPSTALTVGTPAVITVVTSSQHPIDFALGQ